MASDGFVQINAPIAPAAVPGSLVKGFIATDPAGNTVFVPASVQTDQNGNLIGDGFKIGPITEATGQRLIDVLEDYGDRIISLLAGIDEKQAELADMPKTQIGHFGETRGGT